MKNSVKVGDMTEKRILDMANPLTTGSKAPDFSLKDNCGTTVSLGDFKENNNVVLVFYPKNNTPG